MKTHVHVWSDRLFRWYPSASVSLCVVVLTISTLESTLASQVRGDASRAYALQRERYIELQDRFATELETLAKFCDEKQLVKEAADTRQLAEPFDTGRMALQELPRDRQAEIPGNLPPDQHYHAVHLRQLQSKYARDLYMLARSVLRAGFGSFAMDLIREVAFHDPDHRQARELLGYVRLADEWVTPFEKKQRTSPQRLVWHQRFGWLPENHVQRYENGERRFRGRWLPADEEAVLRQDFKNGWKVRTDHFEVQTNHSLERAVEIATRLEDFRRFFSLTFAEFFASPDQIDRRLAGSLGPSMMTKPHKVDYFRTQKEYVQQLVRAVPQIAITNGLYYTPNRTSYYYEDPRAEDPFDTVYHEATHQFLYEHTRVDRGIAEDAHFWIIEGIACYMESFRPVDGGFEYGDPRHIRIEAARYRVLHDGYYVPLARFASMGLKEFQSQGENLSRNYSQASGLAHFFMHYKDGLYRDALIAHLRALYAVPRRGRRVRVPSLAELTGVSYGDLDRQYITYMKQMSDQYDRQP